MARGFLRTALLILALGVSFRPGPAIAANAVQLENAKPGTTDWKLSSPGWASGVIEGYASLTSVDRGGQIKFFVNTSAPSFTIEIFRMGYYGGAGGRRMTPPVTIAGTVQALPSPDPATGLIECNWVNPYVLTIPRSSDPTDWMSGVYLAKLTAGDSAGKQQYIMFVVRDDARASDLLMAQTVNTYQAYNVWGGKSLYGTIAARTDSTNRAVKVSFDRPYYGDEGNGAALFFNWELPMIRWLEAEGYDVGYATNVDVDRDPALLPPHRAFLSVGHDEYWSWRMRDNVEAARDRGVSLGFFSGNTSYWQVRYESAASTGAAARTMVGYKDRWAQDPITPDYFKTNVFRSAPVNRPEESMIGVSFVTQARPALVVEDASHWAFTGTGLKNGDVVTNPDGSAFLGYEVDAMAPLSPANTRRLAHSPATGNRANFCDMTVYRAASGATVFSTGSIGWSQTVPQIQQITRNVLARLVSGAFEDAPPARPNPPSNLAAADIGAVGRAGFVSLAGPQSVTVNGAGKETVDGSDALYYLYGTLNGDGEIVARLTALQLYWDNRAGVMIRESLAPEARYVALVGRPSESRGALLEGVELKVKATSGAPPKQIAALDQKLPNWLRLARRGDVFQAYASADGVTWQSIGSTTLALGASAYIGLAVASSRTGVWATASFDNIAITPALTAPAPAPAPAPSPSPSPSPSPAPAPAPAPAPLPAPPAGPPFGVIDTPSEGATGVAGSLPITGWVLDDGGIARVRIWRDPVAGEAPGQLVYIADGTHVKGARPDVAAAYPNYPESDRAGWGYLMLTNVLPNGGDGTFRIYAYAEDASGNTVLLGTRTFTCANSTSTVPFGTIDTPGQGDTVKGIVNNFGWVLSRGTRRADPPGGGVVTVYIDGVAVGSPGGWTGRPDLIATFPAAQYSGIGSAAGVFTFDSTRLADGVHTIGWSVTDNHGTPAGVGSRFFTVANGVPAASGSSIAAPRASSAASVLARVGFDSGDWYEAPVSIDGSYVVHAEELDRIEVTVHATGAAWLPPGATLGSDGTFTWQPGPGFVGAYGLAFDTASGRRALTVVLHGKGSGNGSGIWIESPAARQDVSRQFILRASLALDVETAHVWAYPEGGGAPRFLAVAVAQGGRIDVPVDSLEPGRYTLALFAWSRRTGGFLPAQTLPVTVR